MTRETNIYSTTSMLNQWSIRCWSWSWNMSTTWRTWTWITCPSISVCFCRTIQGNKQIGHVYFSFFVFWQLITMYIGFDDIHKFPDRLPYMIYMIYIYMTWDHDIDHQISFLSHLMALSNHWTAVRIVSQASYGNFTGAPAPCAATQVQ